MINKNQFETYFYLTKEKFNITVFEKDLPKPIFFTDQKLTNNTNNFDFKDLESLIEKKIYLVEKNIDNFIDEIFLIIDDQTTLEVTVSYKKRFEGLQVSDQDLKYLLTEIKQQIYSSYEKFLIAHFLIDKFIFDQDEFDIFPKGKKCRNLFVNIRIILLKKDLIMKLKKLFKYKHILIEKSFCANYIRNFFGNEPKDLMQMSKEIKDGCNISEVTIIPKKTEKKGFFDRFFHFFS